MSAKRIVFPTDYSPPAQAALPWATALARSLGAKLLLTHVDERLPAYRLGPGYSGVSEPGLQELVKELVAIQPSDAKVDCEHRLLLGDPAQEIVQLAGDERADLIVMASHGRTGLARTLVGSVAEHVLRHAPCPVLIYKSALPAAPSV